MRQMTRDEVALMKLDSLREEHRRLDDEAEALSQRAMGAMQLELQRIKRRKLMLKDAITRLENQLTPDIIA